MVIGDDGHDAHPGRTPFSKNTARIEKLDVRCRAETRFYASKVEGLLFREGHLEVSASRKGYVWDCLPKYASLVGLTRNGGLMTSAKRF